MTTETTPTLPEIKSATQFSNFMEEVWRMDCAPADEGGVILSGSDLYERFHNARGAAEFFGAARLCLRVPRWLAHRDQHRWQRPAANPPAWRPPDRRMKKAPAAPMEKTLPGPMAKVRRRSDQMTTKSLFVNARPGVRWAKVIGAAPEAEPSAS
jgi:hypothetical protein